MEKKKKLLQWGFRKVKDDHIPFLWKIFLRKKEINKFVFPLL